MGCLYVELAVSERAAPLRVFGVCFAGGPLCLREHAKKQRRTLHPMQCNADGIALLGPALCVRV